MELMKKVFKAYLDNFVVVIIGDILICSLCDEGYKEHLRIVYHILMQHKLYAKFYIHEFWQREIPFLGCAIMKEGIKVGPDKI